jgi:hypothetical protein
MVSGTEQRCEKPTATFVAGHPSAGQLIIVFVHDPLTITSGHTEALCQSHYVSWLYGKHN